VPETNDEFAQMVKGMKIFGMRSNKAEANFNTRITANNKATREFERDTKPPGNRKVPENGRKSSC
jgi:hypothetical protein